MKKYLEKNVYEATMERIKFIFDEFDNVLVSFSGGKDSGVMLNLCYDYAKENKLLDKLAMYYMDYEADYQETYEYIKRSFDENFAGIKKYWLCLPISAQCSCSMTETHWIPWDADKKGIWVKPMPDSPHVINESNCPYVFKKGTYGRDAKREFTTWFSSKYGKTAVLIGIRCDESLSRLSTITSQHRAYEGYLISIGSWQVPWDYIQADSYDVSSNKEKLTDWIDYNNRRHVVYSKGTQVVISFKTREDIMMDNDILDEFRNALERAKTTNKNGYNVDSYDIHYFDPATGNTRQVTCTLEDLKFPINGSDETNVYYSPVTFTFQEVALVEL